MDQLSFTILTEQCSSLNSIMQTKVPSRLLLRRNCWEAQQKAILKLSGVSVPDSEPEREMDYDDEADEYDDDELLSFEPWEGRPSHRYSNGRNISVKQESEGKKFSGSDTDPEEGKMRLTRSQKDAL